MQISWSRAKELLEEAGLVIDFPVAGDDAGEEAEKAGNYELAAAAYLHGCGSCLGHHRADRMERRAEIAYEKHLKLGA